MLANVNARKHNAYREIDEYYDAENANVACWRKTESGCVRLG
jgi:hypothetical protein